MDVELRATQVGVSEVGLGEFDDGIAVEACGRELRPAQVGVGEVGRREVDGGSVALAIGSELRVAQVGVSESRPSEVDGGIAADAFVGFGRGRELRATQVGVGEVGISEVDEGAVTEGRGSEGRAAQVGVGKTGSDQLDRAAVERGALEVAVRQVRPAQVELLVRDAERGLAACDRPALVAGGALLEHVHGARRGRRRRGRGASATQKRQQHANASRMDWHERSRTPCVTKQTTQCKGCNLNIKTPTVRPLQKGRLCNAVKPGTYAPMHRAYLAPHFGVF